MLSNLRIENIAIIQNASIDFDGGFNCMTGETGAGKSIVIDSINVVLGEKTSRDIIRTGENRASVSALFTDISERANETVRELGLPAEDDGTLMISRVISRDGKNVCRVNGAGATVSMLKKISYSLINIHGQADNQQLMLPEKHYAFIDAVAGNEALLKDYYENYLSLQRIRSEIDRINVDDAYKARRTDLLLYQIDELQKADIRVGERDELAAKKKIIANSQKLISSLQTAYGLLSGSDEEPGASSLLFSSVKALSDAAQYLDDASQILDGLNDAAYNVDEYASSIRSLLDNSVFDGKELENIEDRLDLIYRLSAKYGESEEEMLEFLNNAKKELEEIEYSDELLKNLNKQYKKCYDETKRLADMLSQSRKAAAKTFCERVKIELAFLDMPNTALSVRFGETKFTSTGTDDIEFLISPNKGEEPKPLAKIASGGELSRIMLAIKSVLADKDDIQTLIFDEIDSGVSGKAAAKIAVKLSDLSKYRQIICITHLPSIAAYADNHMLISKAVKNGKTFTSVTRLDYGARAAEIARIIGGDEMDSAYLESAKRLLEQAKEHKGEDK